MTMTIEEQIKIVQIEQGIDVLENDRFTEWQRKHTPFNTEKEAWICILKLREYRHNNHLLYCVYKVEFEDGYFWIWEKREIL